MLNFLHVETSAENISLKRQTSLLTLSQSCATAALPSAEPGQTESEKHTQEK